MAPQLLLSDLRAMIPSAAHPSRRGGPRLRRPAVGFTLVGLLVVLAVLGLVMAGVSPALRQIAWEIKLKQSSRDALSTLRSARYRAIKEGQPYCMQILHLAGADPGDIGRDQVRLFQGSDSTDPEVLRFDLAEGILMADPDGNGTIDGFGGTDIVVFNPDGSADNAGGYRLGNPNGSFRELRVDPAATGRIRLRQWDPDEGEWIE